MSVTNHLEYQSVEKLTFPLVYPCSDYFLQSQGVKLTYFAGSHLAPKYFKVVANSKKLVVIMTTHSNNFYPVAVPDRLNCS